jgi:hypothetical protein
VKGGWLARYRRRLRILETTYGSEGVWYVEHNGERIAMLIDPQFVDFRVDYLVVPLTDDVDVRQHLRMDSFWNHARQDGVVFRSKEFGTAIRDAFGVMGFRSERISMRHLHILVGWVMPWECLIAWWRRRRAAKGA